MKIKASHLICKIAKTSAEREAALRLRQETFLVELKRQRIQEADAHDDDACHIVSILAGEVVGTLRLYRLHAEDNDIKIGRVAVRSAYRHKGIGSAMMVFAHEWARNQGYASCYLHAELGARAFYERLGYLAEGEEFMESGAGHVLMRRV